MKIHAAAVLITVLLYMYDKISAYLRLRPSLGDLSSREVGGRWGTTKIPFAVGFQGSR